MFNVLQNLLYSPLVLSFGLVGMVVIPFILAINKYLKAEQEALVLKKIGFRYPKGRKITVGDLCFDVGMQPKEAKKILKKLVRNEAALEQIDSELGIVYYQLLRGVEEKR